MFERYTERARRVLFFARYEASQFGNRTIRPEHLLLGLVREGKGLTSRLFSRHRLSLEELRRDLEGRIEFEEKLATSVEIPFEATTKRILQYSAEEADRLLHNYIGTEHLLLAILREDTSVAAEMLLARGLRIDTVREQIVELLREPPPAQRGQLPGTQNPAHFFTHGINLKTLLAGKLNVNARRLEMPPGLDRTLAIDREQREVDVFVLGAVPGRTPAPCAASDAGGGISVGSVAFATAFGIDQPTGRPPEDSPASIGPLSMSETTMAELAAMLEEVVGRPVIDESGLDGRYNVEVTGPHDSIDSFGRSLEREMGLTLTPAKRAIEMTVVR
jgi:hypothetical protein